MIECNRTMEQARRDFAAGRLNDATVLRVPMTASQWSVRLSGKSSGAGMLLSVQTLAPQVFERLDDAVTALEKIGFTVGQLKAMP